MAIPDMFLMLSNLFWENRVSHWLVTCPVLGLQTWAILIFLKKSRFWGSNSGSHGCKPRVLPWLSLQPHVGVSLEQAVGYQLYTHFSIFSASRTVCCERSWSLHDLFSTISSPYLVLNNDPAPGFLKVFLPHPSPDPSSSKIYEWNTFYMKWNFLYLDP